MKSVSIATLSSPYFSISSTTSLKFYAKDYSGHCSNVSVVNYIFSKVGNLNNGKGFIVFRRQLMIILQKMGI